MFAIVSCIQALLTLIPHAATQAISQPGDIAHIQSWRLQSSAELRDSMDIISQPGANVSTWYEVSARSTVISGLLQNGLYDEDDLFFSQNLDSAFDPLEFQVPWLYRTEFDLNPEDGQFYFLHTHGVTSRADIWVNGHVIATKEVQAGAYGGRTYEISETLTNGKNCLLIQAYPTNFLRDFAIGFVDWNPYPADNGTGVWRDVDIHQSGPFSVSSQRITTDFEYDWKQSVTLTIHVDVSNNADKALAGNVTCFLESPDGEMSIFSRDVSLDPGEEQTVTVSSLVKNAQIWWPAHWGEQPLYRVTTHVLTGGVVSDIAATQSFGIRHVSSYVNAHNDTAFIFNGYPFFVQGAGYSSDIFYRFETNRARTQLQLALDMGLNTIRLEGKQEHPELYQLADEMGMMIIAGWECCDKWEGWSYNDEADGVKWSDDDYQIANISMLHEAAWMQAHPSFLAFLVGSDFWPDDRATQIYVDALDRYRWPNPIIASAAKRGYPELLGPSGMKMDGPYDWVPPDYWWADELGAAFGFGSELGAGVGTPEMGSLRQFLSEDDLNDLWQSPDKGLYHMSTNVSSFFDRSIYNQALFSRYGSPKSLEDYLLKAQIMDYEATRAQFETFAARKMDTRPATGHIYWMLNGAWPNLHWQLFDYYLATAGSYFGTKVGTRLEHAVYNPVKQNIYVVSHMLNSTGHRNLTIDLIDLQGNSLGHQELTYEALPNSAQRLDNISMINNVTDVAFMKLALTNAEGMALSRNVYWISAQNDVLEWTNSSWYSTPVVDFADMTALFEIDDATVNVTISEVGGQANSSKVTLSLTNLSDHPAFFVRLNLIDDLGNDVLPVFWTDNYITIFPREQLHLESQWNASSNARSIEVSGVNVEMQRLPLSN